MRLILRENQTSLKRLKVAQSAVQIAFFYGRPMFYSKEQIERNPKLSDIMLFHDIFGRESPRGRVLISTGYFEQLLEDILKAFLLDASSTNEILDSSLSSFVARIKISHALGLLSDWEFQDLETMRKIRNHFAHSMVASFEDKKVIDLCKNFKHRHDGPDNPQTPELQFTSSTAELVIRLAERSARAKEKKLTFEAWPY